VSGSAAPGRETRTLLDRAGAALDRFQRRHALVGFPLAVRQKYSDDGGGYLAATIAYYGFFSLFPLLLVLVTVLGYVLHGDPKLEHRILTSAFGRFPVVGAEIKRHGLKGSSEALAIGVLIATWTGMGVMLAAESAMARIWNVSADRRPGFVAARLRALLLIALLGGGVLAASVLSGLGAGGRFGLALQIVSFAGSLVVNFGLIWVGFRVLTPGKVAWSQLRNGAIAAAAGYEATQILGSYYVEHTLRHASNVYGTFALVIGLLSWIYLNATVVLLAAEANVVAARRLWPQPLLRRDSSSGQQGRLEP